MSDFRPPMNHCDGAPNAFTVADACEVAHGLINAHLALLSGNSVTKVRIGERETDYNRLGINGAEDARKEAMRWCRICAQVNPSQYRLSGLAAWYAENNSAGRVYLPSHNRPFG